MQYLKDTSIQILGAAFGGIIAIVGAWCLFLMQQDSQSQRQSETEFKAIEQEVRNVSRAAQQFLKHSYRIQECQKDYGKSPIVEDKKRAGFRSYDTSRWSIGSASVPENLYGSYAEFYALVNHSNFMAAKVQYGKYQSEEGVFFTLIAEDLIEKADLILDERTNLDVAFDRDTKMFSRRSKIQCS